MQHMPQQVHAGFTNPDQPVRVTLSLSARQKAHYSHVGLAWREAGALSMALLWMNRFLDVAEAIEDGEHAEIDLGHMAGVDLPGRVRVPKQPSVSAGHHEEVGRLPSTAMQRPLAAAIRGCRRAC